MKARLNLSFAAFITAGLLFAAACKEPRAQAQQPISSTHPAPVTCPDSADISPRQVILFILDRSLSIGRGVQDQWNEIREEASHLVRRLPSATRMFVRYISEKSYPEQERAVKGSIPAEVPPVQCQPFDPRCLMAEQQRKMRVHCVDEARERLVAAVQDLNPARSNKTDVWGAIAAASDVLSAYPQSQKMIVIYSDLIDTVGTKLPDQLPGLAHTLVLVRLVKNGDPKETMYRLSLFSERLAQWGAAVRAIEPDGPSDGGIFVQPPVTGNLLTAAK